MMYCTGGTRLIIMVGLFAGMATLTLAGSMNSAYAPGVYKPGDPAERYSCFATDADGGYNASLPAYVDKDGNLVPCTIDHGDNAWMLTSAALVLMMTPAGLAVFYGGLTRQKNAVNTLHMVFITTGVVAIQYVLWGYSLAFGPDAGGYGFIGNLNWAGLNNVLHDVPSNAYGGIDGFTIPHITYSMFQMMFAIITPALIVAALAERMKFSAFIIFIILWATFVYDFAAHWTWEITAKDNYGLNPGYCNFGWTGCFGSLDFAGGTVIHITSGFSGLIIAL